MYCNVSFETLQPVVLTGASHPLFATTLAAQLGIPLTPIQSTVFADGTYAIDIQQPLNHRHVVIIQSIGPLIHSAFMELLFLIERARHAGAARITIVCPFFGFRRNTDQLTLAARLLHTAGADNILVMDMHEQSSAHIFQNAGIQYTELSAIPLFMEAVQTQKCTVLVAPDTGAYHRILQYKKHLSIPIEQLHKRRTTDRPDEVFFETHYAAVKGKRVIMIDDEINTGATMIGAAMQLKKSGAAHISLYATHGIFSADAQYRLAHSPIDSYSVTNTLQQALTTHTFSVVHLFAQALTREIGIFQ